jgi:serine protease Do
MNKKNLLMAAGAAALGLGLTALPSPSKSFQEPPSAPTPTPPAEFRVAPDTEDLQRGLDIVTSLDEGGSWLGLETREVTSEKAKELKLPAERGALVGKVLQDSPAAKAGLKEGDVITEINGQRVEGTAQFRRMIREIPAGRTVQIGIWREGRTQMLSATLGKTDEGRRLVAKAAPQVFKFKIPDMPEVTPLPDMEFDWDGGALLGGKPRLGIDAEDLNDQLGSYFRAPDGEGILVRSVNPGSAAEKAGVRAGDVITSLDGERIHGLAELRSKLAGSGEGKTVKLGVLRNKSALTLHVEIPSVKVKSAHRLEMRTKI